MAAGDLATQGAPFLHESTVIPARISNNMQYKVWEEITCPFRNFNSCTIEVREVVWSNTLLGITFQRWD